MDLQLCGIDPGLETTGYAIVRCNGGRMQIRDAGVCRTDRSVALPVRLAQIEADFRDLLEQSKPDVMAVEQLYAHYRHPRTAILMGHARGVMLSAAASRGIPVRDYAATHVKRILTGNGHASKGQVQRAVAVAYGLDQLPEPPDVADALAIALCCALDLQQSESHLAVVAANGAGDPR